MAWTLGPYTLAGGAEQWIPFYWGPDAAPTYHGTQVAHPSPPLPAGGSFAVTGQGIRNIGTAVDQRIQYQVRVRNLGGTGTFYLRGGGVT
jgi:hypothetical protein